jgi:hypothetical protein
MLLSLGGKLALELTRRCVLGRGATVHGLIVASLGSRLRPRER